MQLGSIIRRGKRGSFLHKRRFRGHMHHNLLFHAQDGASSSPPSVLS